MHLYKNGEAVKMSNSKGLAQAAVGLGLQVAGQPLSQAAGLAGFKETAYMYKGPQFRPFSFNFRHIFQAVSVFPFLSFTTIAFKRPFPLPKSIRLLVFI